MEKFEGSDWFEKGEAEHSAYRELKARRKKKENRAKIQRGSVPAEKS